MSAFGQVRFSKIFVLVRLWFCLAKSVFVASVLVGCRFWLFGVSANYVLPLPKIKLCVKIRRVGGGSGFQSARLAQSLPTKRAPDVWDSARFSSIFLASGFSASRSESQPAHTRVTQTVGKSLH